MSTQPTIMMTVRGLKSDLDYDEMIRRAEERMPMFREVQGLLQKYYSYDEATDEWAGIYLWDSQESLDEFLASELRESIPAAYELKTRPQVDVVPLVAALRT